MSSNPNDMINLSNYEEWFILYMDDELTNGQKAEVDAFLLQHPHLQEELDLLLSTKLPVDPVSFTAKEELLADAMKLNAVDESLLLYIDNELPAAEKKAVETKINTDESVRLQHHVLLQTKLDAADTIPYPDKKELYRHTEKVVFFATWMRVAVAVVVLLFGSLFFLVNQNNQPAPGGVAVNTKPSATGKPQTPVIKTLETPASEAPVIALQQPAETGSVIRSEENERPATLQQKQPVEETYTPESSIRAVAVHKVEPIKIDLAKLTQQPSVAVNNLVANPDVTSATLTSYNPIETPEEPAVTDGDYKGARRSSAKGFLRKVSRFIEKRTGIGTVNADNELLVGAVALKLN